MLFYPGRWVGDVRVERESVPRSRNDSGFRLRRIFRVGPNRGVGFESNHKVHPGRIG